MRTYKKPHVRPATYNNYSVKVNNHINPAIGFKLQAKLYFALCQLALFSFTVYWQYTPTIAFYRLSAG